MGSKNAKTGKTPKGGTLWDLVVFEISYVVKASEFTPPLPPLYQVRFGLGQVRFVLVAFKSLETMYQTLASFGIWLETPYQTFYIMVMLVKCVCLHQISKKNHAYVVAM